MKRHPRNQVGFEPVTVEDTAIGLTVPDAARRAVIRVSGADIRWRADDIDPTATVGQYVADGERIDWQDEADWRSVLLRAKFIRTGATDATLEVTYLS